MARNPGQPYYNSQDNPYPDPYATSYDPTQPQPTSSTNAPAAPQPYNPNGSVSSSPNPSSPYMPGSGYAFTGNNTVTNAQGQTGGVGYTPTNGWSFTPNTTNGATSNQNAKDALMALLNSGMDPQQAIAQINSQYGLGSGQSGQYYAPGSKGPGSGAVIGLAGYGGYYAQNPDGSWGWVPSSEQGSENIGGGAGQMGGGSSSSSTNPLFNQDQMNQIFQALKDQYNRLNTPVTADDPSVAPAIAANRLAEERGLQGNQQALAEQAYAKGDLNSGGYPAAQQLAREQAASNEATFAGNTINQANLQRQALLSNLLGIGGGILNNSGNLQLGADNLGFNYANLQALLNRQAVLSLLGG